MPYPPAPSASSSGSITRSLRVLVGDMKREIEQSLRGFTIFGVSYPSPISWWSGSVMHHLMREEDASDERARESHVARLVSLSSSASKSASHTSPSHTDLSMDCAQDPLVKMVKTLAHGIMTIEAEGTGITGGNLVVIDWTDATLITLLYAQPPFGRRRWGLYMSDDPFPSSPLNVADVAAWMARASGASGLVDWYNLLFMLPVISFMGLPPLQSLQCSSRINPVGEIGEAVSGLPSLIFDPLTHSLDIYLLSVVWARLAEKEAVRMGDICDDEGCATSLGRGLRDTLGDDCSLTGRHRLAGRGAGRDVARAFDRDAVGRPSLRIDPRARPWDEFRGLYYSFSLSPIHTVHQGCDESEAWRERKGKMPHHEEDEPDTGEEGTDDAEEGIDEAEEGIDEAEGGTGEGAALMEMEKMVFERCRTFVTGMMVLDELFSGLVPRVDEPEEDDECVRTVPSSCGSTSTSISVASSVEEREGLSERAVHTPRPVGLRASDERVRILTECLHAVSLAEAPLISDLHAFCASVSDVHRYITFPSHPEALQRETGREMSHLNRVIPFLPFTSPSL
jgi:hypothetical protein